MSKFFKTLNKSKKIAQAPDPRAMDAIQADYAQLKGQTGEIQYQVYALTQTLEQLNRKLLDLNHEGAARQKLDAAAPKTEQTTEATNGQ